MLLSPIVLQGKFKSGESDTLKLVRYNYNGDIQDVIILGESDIIIGIVSITWKFLSTVPTIKIQKWQLIPDN